MVGCGRFDHEREPSAALAAEKVLHREFIGADGDKLLHGGPVPGSGEVGKVVSKLVVGPGGRLAVGSFRMAGLEYEIEAV